jgi:hypothetical protein
LPPAAPLARENPSSPRFSSRGIDDVLNQIQRLVGATGPSFSQSDRCNFAIDRYTFNTHSYILRAYALVGNCDKHQHTRQNSTVDAEQQHVPLRNVN